MRAPPPFECTCADGPLWRIFQVALFALAAAALGAWTQAPDWGVGLAVLAGAAAGACLARPLRARLAWDGAQWQLQFEPPGRGPGRAPGPGPGLQATGASVQATLDLGGWMLLKLRPPGGRVRWLGVSRVSAGPAWHLLRAAVYCAPPDLRARTDEGRAAP